MFYKEISSAVLLIGVIIKVFGFYWFFTILLALISSFLTLIAILLAYTKTKIDSSKKYLAENPQKTLKTLGLSICSPKKPADVHVVSPNIKIATGTEKLNEKGRASNFLDSLFKKHGNRNIKDGLTQQKTPDHQKKGDEGDGKQNFLFDNIKIYTERRKSSHSSERKDVPLGVECSTKSKEAENQSSSKKYKIFSGNKEVDKLIHTIIDYIIRDFIDSWFTILSDNKEFVESNVRGSIEEFVSNICKRIKNKQSDLVPLITTKLMGEISSHTKIYRLSSQSIKNEDLQKHDKNKKLLFQYDQKKEKSLKEHRRNKSDTDLKWNIGNAMIQKTVANSTFYSVQTEENNLVDPEKRLIQTFFENSSNVFKKECMDDQELELHLTHIVETVLYFCISTENFSCLTLRSLVATIIANIGKLIINMLSDPDFINLTVARQLINEIPPAEFLIRMIRQSNDLSELRAVRQLITSEMDLKYKDASFSAELASLKYTQKLIDIRISNIQNHRYKNNDKKHFFEKEKISNLLILPLDEILNKEIALSYYLDYLSILNLQKYVIFYLVANEWKRNTNQKLTVLHNRKNQTVNLTAHQKEEILRQIRDKAFAIFKEYLMPASNHFLNIDAGLIEVLHIKIKDTFIQPESSWFESISKFVYEKLKNEDVFLANFYQSSAYKKLLLELDITGHPEELSGVNSDLKLNTAESESDSNSGDLLLDDDIDELEEGDFNIQEKSRHTDKFPETIATSYLDPNKQRFHQRSHSDTGVITQKMQDDMWREELDDYVASSSTEQSNIITITAEDSKSETKEYKQKISAKIINTAINTEGQFAVYAIQVRIIEDQVCKRWHIYRRYSKFLEFKKLLLKRFPDLGKLPFPAKKTFQNTQRNVLEFRMNVLNDFLMVITAKAENNDDMAYFIKTFLEPDSEDKKLHGGSINKTIETLVNPLKSGMRSIRNMPDTFIDGLSRLFLGKTGSLKDHSFVDLSSSESSNEYPALTAVLHLMDEVFDLQARSQWLRKGLINRLLGAPWISMAANRKILQGIKSLIELNKVESLLTAVLHNVWPDGVRHSRDLPREDSTKLRTRLVAKIAMFALLSDELKHVLGSETTRIGLFNFFEMLQHSQLNKRLILVLLHDILATIFTTESMVQHVIAK